MCGRKVVMAFSTSVATHRRYSSFGMPCRGTPRLAPTHALLRLCPPLRRERERARERRVSDHQASQPPAQRVVVLGLVGVRVHEVHVFVQAEVGSEPVTCGRVRDVSGWSLSTETLGCHMPCVAVRSTIRNLETLPRSWCCTCLIARDTSLNRLPWLVNSRERKW